MTSMSSKVVKGKYTQENSLHLVKRATSISWLMNKEMKDIILDSKEFQNKLFSTSAKGWVSQLKSFLKECMKEKV